MNQINSQDIKIIKSRIEARIFGREVDEDEFAHYVDEEIAKYENEQKVCIDGDDIETIKSELITELNF